MDPAEDPSLQYLQQEEPKQEKDFGKAYQQLIK